jgi:hypothetical protein
VIDRDASLTQRALFIWPRLDHRKLADCDDDAAKIARPVAQRTRLPPESVIEILLRPDRRDDEPSFYFG